MDVFVSTSYDTRDFVEHLVRDIESCGISVWFAPRDMRVGVDWKTGITEGIRATRVFLPALSAGKVENPQQLFEIKLALSINKNIIRILAQKNAVTPPLLFHYRFIDFSNEPDYQANLKSLVQEIKVTVNNG